MQKTIAGSTQEITNKLDIQLSRGFVSHQQVTSFLIQHYYGALHRLAMSIVENKMEADDVCQRTIIRASEKIDQYQPGTNLTGWIFKIAINEARTILRRRKRRDRLKQILTLGAFVTKPVTHPEAILLKNERNRALWDAVKQLSEKHQLPILLRYSFELSDTEIADVLDIPSGTVRSRLHHAHKQLFGLLASSNLITIQKNDPGEDNE